MRSSWSWMFPDYWQTHRDLGLYSMFHGDFQQESTNGQTNKQTDATKHIISPASWSITRALIVQSHDDLGVSALIIKGRYGTPGCDQLWWILLRCHLGFVMLYSSMSVLNLLLLSNTKPLVSLIKITANADSPPSHLCDGLMDCQNGRWTFNREL